MVNYEVYIINETGTDYYKIGRTGNIDRRVKSLNTGNPRELVVSKLNKCSKSVIANIEKEAHLKFADKKVHGEWFKFTKQEVDDVCEFISKSIDNKSKEKANKCDVKSNSNPKNRHTCKDRSRFTDIQSDNKIKELEFKLTEANRQLIEERHNTLREKIEHLETQLKIERSEKNRERSEKEIEKINGQNWSNLTSTIAQGSSTL